MIVVVFFLGGTALLVYACLVQSVKADEAAEHQYREFLKQKGLRNR